MCVCVCVCVFVFTYACGMCVFELHSVSMVILQKELAQRNNVYSRTSSRKSIVIDTFMSQKTVNITYFTDFFFTEELVG